jgi:hypothetical protein
MLITKEQQYALIDKYIKEKHNQYECIGFIDGLNAMLELISKIEKRRMDELKEAISIIEEVLKSMPECTNKAFLKGALNELNEAKK